MTHVSIIGTGNMSQGISGLVTKGGNTVELLGHSDTGKPVTGDIVVLAVPHAAIADILATRGDQLAGKVVVDITNPLNFQTFDSLTVPADSSAAAQIAASLPQSRVVKAFNTNLAATVASAASATWMKDHTPPASPTSGYLRLRTISNCSPSGAADVPGP